MNDNHPSLTKERAKAAKVLTELIDIHRQAHPDDPFLALHEGRLKYDAGQCKQAAEVMSPVLAKLPRTGDPNRDLESGYLPLRREMILARYKAGEAAVAFRELQPHSEVFAQLVDLLVTDKDASEVHRQVAREVLAGKRPSSLPGARKYFEPGQQDAVYKQVQAGKAALARGEQISERTKLLIKVGYKYDADGIRKKWSGEGSRKVGSIGPVEFWT